MASEIYFATKFRRKSSIGDHQIKKKEKKEENPKKFIDLRSLSLDRWHNLSIGKQANGSVVNASLGSLDNHAVQHELSSQGEEGGRPNFFVGETIFQLEPWTLHNSAMIAFHLKGTGV